MYTFTKHAFAILILFSAIAYTGSCGNGSYASDKVTEDSIGGNEYPKAPEAILNTEVKMLEGGTYRVADQQGKVVLINLWATWCGPCRNEMPELVKLQEELGPQGLEIIGLDVDPEPEELVRPFVEQMKLNYKVGWAPESMVEEFFKTSERNGIPQSFVIDREGRLTGIYFGVSPNVIATMKKNVTALVTGES